MSKFVLGIDQGTTGSTVALMDARGKLRARVNYEFPQIYPRPGWVEQRPADIWASVGKGIRAIFRKGICKPSQIVAIGITNQRETSLLWDKQTGEPFNNAIVWQCRRTSEFCESLRAAGHENAVRRRSGLVLDPYFSASKYRWLLKNTVGISKAVTNKRVAAGTIDSFLVWQLTGGDVHVTDVSNASRTSLMTIKTGRWD
jgi:glycerol kinase